MSCLLVGGNSLSSIFSSQKYFHFLNSKSSPKNRQTLQLRGRFFVSVRQGKYALGVALVGAFASISIIFGRDVGEEGDGSADAEQGEAQRSHH